MSTSVIVSGARTPIGRLMGSLKDFRAVDLGAIAIRGALEKGNVPASEVEYVIMGQVLGAGAGQMPAKQTAVQGRYRLGRPRALDQQDVSVRDRRDRVGRPADPCR